MTEPSKFFTQHHAVEAPTIDERSFRPFWRVRTHLDALLIDGAIGWPVWRAAVEYRTLAEVVLAGQWPAKWLDADQADNSRGGFDVSIAFRIDAVDRLKSIHRALGNFPTGLLQAHLVDDLKWVELGRRYSVHAKTARSWTVVTLGALAEVIWNGGSR